MASEPRIAVICVGYLGNPAGVRRLAGYFAVSGARLYVHIDAKVDIAPYWDAVAGYQHATLIAERHRIYWGGFSLVRMVIAALEAARADADFDRYVFLTEDTVPLMDAALFVRLMQGPEEFMHVYGNLDAPIWRRYEDYFLFDCDEMNPRTQPQLRVVTPDLAATLARLEALRRRGKLPIERLFHGSTWWALSWRAVDEILVHWAQSGHLRDSFEFSMIPEEQYFHTILGNAARQFVFRPFIYTDSDRDPRPFVFRTMAELTSLQALPFLFARKVALDSSDATRFVEARSV